MFDFTTQFGLFANNGVFGTAGDGVNLPVLNAGLAWSFNYTSSELSVAAVPNSGMLALIGLGVMAMSERRRKK